MAEKGWGLKKTRGQTGLAPNVGKSWHSDLIVYQHRAALEFHNYHIYTLDMFY